VPELPEVETVRRDLEQLVPGKRITAVEATNARVLRRHPDPQEFVARLTGRKITGVGRWGKYLLVDLDRGGSTLIVHLGMSGQLLWSSPNEPRVKHTHVVVTCNSKHELRYVDPRTFGELFVIDTSPAECLRIGVDAFEGIEGPDHLGRLLRARKRKLKDLLMGQTCIAGLGNIYTDEVLFLARLRADRQSQTLSDDEVLRLHDAIAEILGEAVALRGSSLRDQQYRDVAGDVGSYQSRHRVYAREGQPCVNCGRPLSRIVAGGRSHFFCEACQE
jgi:formamidopyrimidine-DNA glycosylase